MNVIGSRTKEPAPRNKFGYAREMIERFFLSTLGTSFGRGRERFRRNEMKISNEPIGNYNVSQTGRGNTTVPRIFRNVREESAREIETIDFPLVNIRVSFGADENRSIEK